MLLSLCQCQMIMGKPKGAADLVQVFLGVGIVANPRKCSKPPKQSVCCTSENPANMNVSAGPVFWSPT